MWYCSGLLTFYLWCGFAFQRKSIQTHAHAQTLGRLFIWFDVCGVRAKKIKRSGDHMSYMVRSLSSSCSSSPISTCSHFYTAISVVPFQCIWNTLAHCPFQNVPVQKRQIPWPLVLLLAAFFENCSSKQLHPALHRLLSNTPDKCEADRMNGWENPRTDIQTNMHTETILIIVI